jgi:hypothetical protein
LRQTIANLLSVVRCIVAMSSFSFSNKMTILYV